MEKILILGFILAILYFITTELACNGHTHIDNNVQSEQKALIDFKSGLKDPNNRLSSWKGSNYCYWQGISCENGTGFVISIDLHNPYPRENVYENWSSMNLSGEISPSLIKLKYLKYLDLSFNSFKAMPVPQFFGSLENLIYLNLSSAGFSGSIPSNLRNLSSLQYLDLSSEYLDDIDSKYLYDIDSEYFNDLFVENIEWMTDLVSLKYLGMNYVNLSLVGSRWVEVANKLPSLTELHLGGCILSGSFPSPSFVNLTSLVVIAINSNYFNSKFPEWLLNVSNLVSIDISDNQLHGRIPLGLGELPNLQYLDLSLNANLRGSISQLLRKSWKKIEVLNLARNELHGSIPSSIGNFCNLKYLDLGANYLNGSLPEIIKGLETCSSKSPLPNLTELILYYNQLMGTLPNWLGELKNLRILYLSDNKFEGPIPASLWTLQHLEYLSLSRNELNGSLPDSVGQLSQLQGLGVSSNHMSGSLSEQHFLKLSKLEYLFIGSNSFHLNVSPNWVPPFQVNELNMGSCHLGPSFPSWLQSQKNLEYLDLSNDSMSSPIPNWFWNISFNMWRLNLSHNQLQGQLPNSLNFYGESDIYFSSNLFEGPIPFSIKGVSFLDLSHNKFSGPIPLSRGESMLDLRYLLLSDNQITGAIPSNIGESLSNLIFLSLSGNRITGTIPDSIGHLSFLEVIDFSRNNLTGSIPSTINNCYSLGILDLGNNNLSGIIPKSLGQLQSLQSLHLNHNKLLGELPSSFQNLTDLEVLDLSYNKLLGEVPAWIGATFVNLVILNLRSNVFCGRLPSQLSNLSSLHVLDIAQNNLMGKIPSTLVELKAMAQEQLNIYRLNMNVSSLYEEQLVVIAKGQILEYTTTLSLVVAIDLSDNNLSGEFPQEITRLYGLVVLNLSRNHITGQIPENISMLRQLSSLDLSSNKISGTIPSSMASLSFLSYLNLSNNNFSGKIPFTGQMTTFTELAFLGNPDLCEPPLATKCQDEDPNKRQSVVSDKNDGGSIDQWFYLSVGLGFAMGILVPFFVLATRKSWCEAYFDFVDEIVRWLLRGRATYAKNHPRRR
ncbi:receptor-like protein EIX1 [Vitis riparia]|uniref:receptor-like protein EIX1 n=1 Tax=Vitis riparia TaxID=96939 RepID=UPI00155A3D3E|nr:receptor-like protein EIX1 [Vitis riparia]